jgi:hypothetical protein
MIWLRDGAYSFADADEIKRHQDNLRLLSQHVPLWPPVDEMMGSSRKLNIIKVLDQIAADVTHTIRPKTEAITLPLKTKPSDVVLKREVSDTSERVIFPDEIRDMSLKALNKKLKYLGEGHQWFKQSFVPALLQFGEWRVYFVGGDIIHIIGTTPIEYRIEVGMIDGIWTLEELT